MLLPAQNRKDVKDLPQEVKDGLEILHVRYVNSWSLHVLGIECSFAGIELTISDSHIWEAIRLVWPDSHWAADSGYGGMESRL